MLIRISLIIAIVASLGAGVISFVKVKEKITFLMTDRDNEKTQKETALRDLSDTKKVLTATKKDLDITKADLATTVTQRDQALTDAANEKKTSTALTAKLEKTAADRDKAQTELAQWNALNHSIDEVSTALKDQKNLRADRTNLVVKISNLSGQLKEATNLLTQLTGGELPIKLDPALRGKVVIVDPKYDFVVLDIGENQNAIEGGILLVNRRGKLVAKLKIRSVQADRCIATVMPGKLGEVMEGDLVLPGI